MLKQRKHFPAGINDRNVSIGIPQAEYKRLLSAGKSRSSSANSARRRVKAVDDLLRSTDVPLFRLCQQTADNQCLHTPQNPENADHSFNHFVIITMHSIHSRLAELTNVRKDFHAPSDNVSLLKHKPQQDWQCRHTVTLRRVYVVTVTVGKAMSTTYSTCVCVCMSILAHLFCAVLPYILESNPHSFTVSEG